MAHRFSSMYDNNTIGSFKMSFISLYKKILLGAKKLQHHHDSSFDYWIQTHPITFWTLKDGFFWLPFSLSKKFALECSRFFVIVMMRKFHFLPLVKWLSEVWEYVHSVFFTVSTWTNQLVGKVERYTRQAKIAFLWCCFIVCTFLSLGHFLPL